jgi:hypothetical protein
MQIAFCEEITITYKKIMDDFLVKLDVYAKKYFEKNPVILAGIDKAISFLRPKSINEIPSFSENM